MIGDLAKDVAKIRARVGKSLDRIALFGSVVNDSSKCPNDVDIVLEVHPQQQEMVAESIRSANLSLPIGAVDIGDYRQTRNESSVGFGYHFLILGFEEDRHAFQLRNHGTVHELSENTPKLNVQ